jgi:cyclin-C
MCPNLSFWLTHKRITEINRLGKRLVVRQQAMATAQIYMKRFYSKVEVRRTNPFLVMATALYLACKMEESPQHIRVVIQEAKSLWPGTLL